MKIGATIYVNGIAKSYEAVELYKEAFGLTLGYNASYEDTSWMKDFGLTVEDDFIPQKGYFHADLMYNGENVFSVSAEGEYEGTSKDFIQLGFSLGSEEAVKKAVSVLSDGKVTPAPCSFNPCVADVVDKFGVWWFLCV